MWYYISGGERSGKTNHAMHIADTLSTSPIYLATARILDANIEKRVAKHIAQRPAHWATVNCEKFLSSRITPKKTVVIDCVTMWISNFFFDLQENPTQTITAMKKELDALSKIKSDLIFVSNEIGMGIHPKEKMSRDFVYIQGTINQIIAKRSDRAFLMVSGLPLTLKNNIVLKKNTIFASRKKRK